MKKVPKSSEQTGRNGNGCPQVHRSKKTHIGDSGCERHGHIGLGGGEMPRSKSNSIKRANRNSNGGKSKI